jgi:hypothetical protein
MLKLSRTHSILAIAAALASLLPTCQTALPRLERSAAISSH